MEKYLHLSEMIQQIRTEKNAFLEEMFEHYVRKGMAAKFNYDTMSEIFWLTKLSDLQHQINELKK